MKDIYIEFLDAIEKVCYEYNLSISHEDCHGAFEIEDYDQRNINWLRDASRKARKEEL